MIQGGDFTEGTTDLTGLPTLFQTVLKKKPKPKSLIRSLFSLIWGELFVSESLQETDEEESLYTAATLKVIGIFLINIYISDLLTGF